MADLKALEEQLKEIGCNFRFWGRAELKELANVLLPGEQVKHCINGQYEGGFALLCATDQRVLLIDKKPMYLTLEDIRFDMISEIDYYHRMLNASVIICTPNKSLRFVAYNHGRLRKLFHYVQTRVMDIRHYYTENSQPGLQSEPAIRVPDETSVMNPIIGKLVKSRKEEVAAINTTNATPAAEATDSFGTTLAVNAGIHHSSSGRHLVPPVISAYTRLPIMSRQRRFLGSRAINTPMPSIYRQL